MGEVGDNVEQQWHSHRGHITADVQQLIFAIWIQIYYKWVSGGQRTFCESGIWIGGTPLFSSALRKPLSCRLTLVLSWRNCSIFRAWHSVLWSSLVSSAWLSQSFTRWSCDRTARTRVSSLHAAGRKHVRKICLWHQRASKSSGVSEVPLTHPHGSTKGWEEVLKGKEPVPIYIAEMSSTSLRFI